MHPLTLLVLVGCIARDLADLHTLVTVLRCQLLNLGGHQLAWAAPAVRHGNGSDTQIG